jgi:hypothetical protein
MVKFEGSPIGSNKCKYQAHLESWKRNSYGIYNKNSFKVMKVQIHNVNGFWNEKRKKREEFKSSVATKNQANVLLMFVIQAFMCDAP